MSRLATLLAFIWGIIWAAVLSLTHLGRYLACQETWLTVVIGVGADLLLCRLFLTLRQWLSVSAVIAASSVGIILRSLLLQRDRHAEAVSLLGRAK